MLNVDSQTSVFQSKPFPEILKGSFIPIHYIIVLKEGAIRMI